jgi:hypothetical protein
MAILSSDALLLGYEPYLSGIYPGDAIKSSRSRREKTHGFTGGGRAAHIFPSGWKRVGAMP